MRENNILDLVALLSALGCGLAAGIFFAFSTFVMKALGKLAPSQGIAAMQSIYVAIINPWFLRLFFGTAGLCSNVYFSEVARAFFRDVSDRPHSVPR
jgi:uncharacterized membrane protein